MIVVARGRRLAGGPDGVQQRGVCRAVAAAATPVVSAVGHERDVTVCDLVADVRVVDADGRGRGGGAETPRPWSARLATRPAARLGRGLVRAGDRAHGGPGRRDAGAGARAAGARRARGGRVRRGWSAWTRSARPGRRRAPRPTWRRAGRAAPRAGEARLGRAEARRVERAAALLALLSPGRTVARGYAIVRDAAGGAVIAVGRGRRGRARRSSSSCATAGSPRRRRGRGERRAAAGAPAVTFEEALAGAGRGGGAARERRGGAGGGRGPVRARARATWRPAGSAWPAAQRRIEELTADGPAGRPGAGRDPSLERRPDVGRSERGRALAAGLPALQPLEVALDRG